MDLFGIPLSLTKNNLVELQPMLHLIEENKFVIVFHQTPNTFAYNNLFVEGKESSSQITLLGVSRSDEKVRAYGSSSKQQNLKGDPSGSDKYAAMTAVLQLAKKKNCKLVIDFENEFFNVEAVFDKYFDKEMTKHRIVKNKWLTKFYEYEPVASSSSSSSSLSSLFLPPSSAGAHVIATDLDSGNGQTAMSATVQSDEDVRPTTTEDPAITVSKTAVVVAVEQLQSLNIGPEMYQTVSREPTLAYMLRAEATRLTLQDATPLAVFELFEQCVIEYTCITEVITFLVARATRMVYVATKIRDDVHQEKERLHNQIGVKKADADRVVRLERELVLARNEATSSNEALTVLRKTETSLRNEIEDLKRLVDSAGGLILQAEDSTSGNSSGNGGGNSSGNSSGRPSGSTSGSTDGKTKRKRNEGDNEKSLPGSKVTVVQLADGRFKATWDGGECIGRVGTNKESVKKYAYKQADKQRKASSK